MGMGMMGPWGRMEGAFRKHMISSLEEKCEQWQRDEFEGLDLADEEQTRVRDLCRDLADSYTAPFELISILSRRNPEEVPYADLYQN
nr:hypothetical protein BaRGS_033749 [Batillaria attramentaria]